MSTLYRAQILLKPEQHHVLTEIARQQGRSLSDLVREIVREHLAQRDRETRLQQELDAIDALAQIRRQVQETHGTYVADLLGEVRAEREQDVEQVWSDQV